MTDPKDPGGEDWGFPEVDPAGPASTVMPAPEPEPAAEFDTGSDAWWRAQAQAQRAASEAETADVRSASASAVAEPPAADVAPPELVEPSVLSAGPSPLDLDWVPEELPEAATPASAPAAPPPPPAVQPRRATPPAAAAPVFVPVDDATDPTGFPALQDDPVWPGPAEPSFEDAARVRTAVEPERVGPARALAGAALAVAGVALGIGALLLLGDDEPKSTPAITLPSPTATPTAQPTPTTGASPTAAPSASGEATPTVPAVVTTSAPPAAAPIVPVTVLNNSRVKNLAERSAARFRAGGWPVPETGNYRAGTIAVTTVYFAPGEQASAQRFASQFDINRVAPRFAGLPGSGTTVVLTRDYA